MDEVKKCPRFDCEKLKEKIETNQLHDVKNKALKYRLRPVSDNAKVK